MLELMRKVLSLSLLRHDTDQERLGNSSRITQPPRSRVGVSSDHLSAWLVTLPPQPGLPGFVKPPLCSDDPIKLGSLMLWIDLVHSHFCASAPPHLFLCPSWDTEENIGLGVRDAGLEARLDIN